jgi:uncharacterized protein YgiM (DUF1202 family)
MKRLDFGFKVFIALFVLCIAGIVFSTIAIDKQIDSYIEEIQTEVTIEVVNNSNNEVIVVREEDEITIMVNPVEETEENEPIITEENYGIVTSLSGLNIRQSPSIDSPKVGTINYGDRVKILEDCGDWYRTENGFIFKEYIIRI